MKDFIVGLAVGALGAYVAIKLSDEETRNRLKAQIGNATDRAREDLDYGLTVGKSKALRAGVRVRQGVDAAKEYAEQTATEMAEKLSDGLADLSEKTRPSNL